MRNDKDRNEINQFESLSMDIMRNGEPETIRTSDPQLRRLLLYPAELRARIPLKKGGGFLEMKPTKIKGIMVVRSNCHAVFMTASVMKR